MELKMSVVAAQDCLLLRQEPQSLMALVDILPSAEAVSRKPINVGLVLDVSGSMNEESGSGGTKIELLRTAVTRSLDLLDTQDRALLITFNSRSRIVGEKKAGETADGLRAKVSSLTAENGTRISRGIEEALGPMQRLLDPQYATQLLLLTDGLTDKDEDECEDLARQFGEAGVPIHAFGLGTDWNAQLLATMGQESGGTSMPLLKADEIEAAFREAMQSAMGLVGRAGKLRLSCVEGVRIEEAARWEESKLTFEKKQLDPANLLMRFNQISAPSGARIPVVLSVAPFPAGRQKLTEVEFTYYTVPDNREERLTGDLVIRFTPSVQDVKPSADQDIQRAVRAFILVRNVNRALEAYQDAIDRGETVDQTRTYHDQLGKLIAGFEAIGAAKMADMQRENLQIMAQGGNVLMRTYPVGQP